MIRSGQSLAGRDLIGIQYLRGLAALMVVAFHLGHQLSRMGYAGPWPPGLASGVDIFFVISGFIMWVTTRNGGISPGAFLKRRVERIVPLYWIFTSLVVAMLLWAPGLTQSAVFDPAHVIASYLFVPAISPATGQFDPVLEPGWTLNCQMMFYLVFAALLAAPRRLRFWGNAAVFGLLVLAGLVFAPKPTSRLAFYTSPILLEFLFGMALARLAIETALLRRIAPPVSLALSGLGLGLILGLPGLLPPDLASRICLGLSATLVVTGILALEARGALPRIDLLKLLGDASYSIYLSQVMSLSAATQLWRRLHLGTVWGGWVGFVLFGLAAGALIGVAVFWLVERPLNAALRARRNAAGPAAMAVSTSAA